MSLSSRSVMALLLLGISLGACDRRSAPAGQDGTGQLTAGEATGGEAPATGSGAEKAPYRIDRSKAGLPMPDAAFADADGQAATLARFRGRPVLVNLWATWCAPCVAELPQLDALAAQNAGKRNGLVVAAISQDSTPPEKVVAFLKSKGIRSLHPWVDPDNNLSLHYGGNILPTSILYDADGREVARIVGAPDWTSAEARALLAAAAG